MNQHFNKGLILTSLGSFWWGFIGVIYFEYVAFIGHVELVVHRCLWTAVMLIMTTLFLKKQNIITQDGKEGQELVSQNLAITEILSKDLKIIFYLDLNKLHIFHIFSPLTHMLHTVCVTLYAKAIEAGKGCPIYLKRINENTFKVLPIKIFKKFTIHL